jgi:BirA family biotin operon repressor/biotin-[acetyl-CoA-carboxylase] ligase
MTQGDEVDLYLALDELLVLLLARGRVAVSEFEKLDIDPLALGLVRHGRQCSLAPGTDLLDESRIRAGFSPQTETWCRNLRVWRAVDSTNLRLMQLAEQSSVDGHVHIAELQIQGRGRRGRQWFSPFARNLAVSLGHAIALEPAELGGLSLAVGLAAADCFKGHGIDVGLKWPNDLLIDGAKLGGILIEVVRRPGGVQAVIGIGVNVEVDASVRKSIDQPVADLRQHGVGAPRCELAAHLIESIHRRVVRFEEAGFADMVEEFNARHVFTDQACTLLQGNHRLDGIVEGVSEEGALFLRTADGVQAFGAGEVSLRQPVNGL